MATLVHSQSQSPCPPVAVLSASHSGPNTNPTSQADPAGATMPQGFQATVARLDTFELPAKVTGSLGDRALGRAMTDAWRRDGIIQFKMDAETRALRDGAMAASRAFFRRPAEEKQACVDDQSYAGYIASGEEITNGVADYSEIFTITKDLPADDRRVQARWPCHGPCPWPDTAMRDALNAYTDRLGVDGEKLLRLVELGLGTPEGALTRYTRDGWHHTRVLRFPAREAAKGEGKEGRGIGSHTDYGLLVISAQDQVGGLFIRRPNEDEKFANWEKSVAGLREDDDGWVYVPPPKDAHTVILGDMMQYLTGGQLVATPHKVGLNTRERFSFAYFHEPSFQAVMVPIGSEKKEGIHYGTHFTNMFMRSYPDRITTKRILAENRYSLLSLPEVRTMSPSPETA